MFEKILKIILFLLIISLPLGQFGKIPVGGQDVGVYINDLLLVAFDIAALIYLLAVKRSYKVNLPIIFGLGFLAWALVTWILGTSSLNVGQSVISFLYWFRLFFGIIFFIEIWQLKKIAPRVTNNLINWLIYSGLLLALAGLIQLAIFPDFGKLDPSLGWDPHYFRLTSTFFDPNFTGAYLVICLTLVWSRLLGRGASDVREITDNRKQITKYLKNNAICYLLSAIFVLAIILTFSRSAWLMLAIVIFIYGVFKSRLILLISLIIAFGAYFAVPRIQTRLSGITDPADSASFRLLSWKQGLQLSSNNLLTGVGFNALRYAKESSEFADYRPNLSTHSGAGFDSSLLVVLATTGIPGVVLFLLFIAGLLIGVMREHKGYINYKILIGSQFLALLVESNFINSLFYDPLMILEFAILGLFVD